MQKFISITLVVIAALTKPTLSKKCTSINGIEVKVYPDDGKKPYKTFADGGCLERQVFDDTIVQAEIQSQNITRLGPDSVRNLIHLHSIFFRDCPIEAVEAAAFRNVPELKHIYIRGGKFTEMPQGVFTNAVSLERLDVSHNRIRSVQDGGFGGMPTLKRLYCHHNELQHYDPNWFYNMTKLEVIDFSYNKVKRLPSEGFVHLKKINNICFDYNELELIQPEAFKGVTKMVYLGLRYNKLKALDASIFPKAVVIDTMRIDANHLNFIPKKLMDRIVAKVLNLNGNPWNCPCFDEVLLWLHRNNGTVAKAENCLKAQVPVCSFASGHSKSCTEEVDNDITRRFLDQLSKLKEPLDKYCARLD